MSEPDDDDPLVRLALEHGEEMEPEGPDDAGTAAPGASHGSANLFETLELADLVVAVVDLLTP